MDVSVLVSWKSVPRPFAWTLGVCPYCQLAVPIRVDEVFQQVAIYFVPIISTSEGFQCHCSLCDRMIWAGLPEHRIPRAEWTPESGIVALGERLKVPAPNQGIDEHGIHSLLTAITQSTLLNSLDISFGLTSGCILGALTGAVVGYFKLPQFLPQMDQLGCVFAGILGGLLFGGLTGATSDAVRQRRSIPFQRIKAAILNFSIAPELIIRMADAYPLRIRSAALRARDAAILLPRSKK
jgi:hypothetical protein